MKSFISPYRLVSTAKEFLALSVVVALSLTAMAQTAHARLIFTTEEDGVNSDAYHLDIDDTSTDFIDLNFGSAVTSQLRYDILNDKFIFTENLDLNGNELQNFQIENLATVGEPTCDGTATGRMYYNTTTNDLLFCDGTVWTSTSSDLSGLAGAGLVVNGAALDVNVDDSTLEIATDTVQVKDAGITAAKLADSSVNGGTAGVITDDSITAADIAAGAVDTSELAADAVTTAEIAADTILAGDIATGAVTTDEILDNTITATDIAASTITTAEIAADTILAGDIATGAVTTDEILDNTITATDIAASTITTAEIALDTITAADIATGAIGTLEIADGTVGTADLASGGNDKLLTTDGSGNVLWVDQAGLVLPTMTSGQMIVADGTGTPTAVTLSGDATVSNTGVVDLAANSVTTAEIAADTILAGDIATGAVTTDEILDNTITATDIAASTITTAEIAADTILAGDIATGAVTTDEILDNTITATDIAASTITTTEIAADTILAGDIATGAVTTDEILDNTVALIDIAERTASESVAPEYPNFTLNADGTNNNGRLESDHDGRNYYAWSTRKNTEQDYDIIWQWAVPENFQSWQANPILLDYKTDTAVAADNSIDITLLDTAGASDTLSAGTGLVSGTADTWVDDGIITASLAGTYTPGEYLTFRIKMKSRYGAGSRHPSYAGAFKLQYNVK